MSLTTTIFALFALQALFAGATILIAKIRTILDGEAYWWGKNVDALIESMPSPQEAWAARHIAELEAKRDAEERTSIMADWDVSIGEMTLSTETKQASKGLSSLMVTPTSITPTLFRSETLEGMLAPGANNLRHDPKELQDAA